MPEREAAVLFADYLVDFVANYQGGYRGKGFRAQTRREYMHWLNKYGIPFFEPKRLKLNEVRIRHCQEYVNSLAAQGLATQSIMSALKPIRRALSVAHQTELINRNPARGLEIPNKPSRLRRDDGEQTKHLTPEQLRIFLDRTPAKHKLLFTLIASTGLRTSEAVALQVKHFQLDGPNSCVQVRRAFVKQNWGDTKTKSSRRDVPLPAELVFKLRGHVKDKEPDALVFPNRYGEPLNTNNIQRRIVKPIMEEVGAGPGSGLHSLRHSYASLQISAGINIVALSDALGHSDPSLTLKVYSHLLKKDRAKPLDLAAMLPQRPQESAERELSELAA